MESYIYTPLGRLRAIALVEGISFLLLLGVAMPLKYLAGIPQVVSAVGMIHGILWIAFLASVAEVRTRHQWPLSRTGWALLSSVVPFGTFVLDQHLRVEQQTGREAATRPDVLIG